MLEVTLNIYISVAVKPVDESVVSALHCYRVRKQTAFSYRCIINCQTH